MDFLRSDFLKAVARRSVLEKRHVMAAMIRIHGSRQAGGFTGKTGEDEVPATALHDFCERLARIAGRQIALENHLRAPGGEAVDPPPASLKGARLRRIAFPAHECNGTAHSSCVGERGSAVRQSISHLK